MLCVTTALLLGIICVPPGEVIQISEFKPWAELRESRLSAHEGGVTTVAFDSTGERLGSSGYDEKVRIWQMPAARLLQTADAGKQQVEFSPDLTGFAWGPFPIQQVDLSMPHRHLKLGGTQVLAYSSDGSLLAAGEGAGSGFVQSAIRIFRQDSGETLGILEGHPAFITGLAFSPNGKLLASSGRDATIRLWSVADRNLVASRKAADGHLAFSPDGRLLASGGSQAGPLALWNVPEMTLKHERHTEGVFDLAFSPDGELLAICFWSDHTSAPSLQLIRISDGQVLQTLIRGALAATCVDFSLKGELLAVGMSDGAIRFFAPPGGE